MNVIRVSVLKITFSLKNVFWIYSYTIVINYTSFSLILYATQLYGYNINSFIFPILRLFMLSLMIFSLNTQCCKPCNFCISLLIHKYISRMYSKNWNCTKRILLIEMTKSFYQKKSYNLWAFFPPYILNWILWPFLSLLLPTS